MSSNSTRKRGGDKTISEFFGTPSVDYHAVLGVRRNASKAAIAKAYRQLVKKYHPDKNKTAGAAERFKEIQEAFEELHGHNAAVTATAITKAKPSKVRRKRKHPVPPKPYAKFPLTPHSSGKWQKKIRGKTEYFGRWGRIVNGKMQRLPNDGWKEAYDLYDAQAAELHAGRRPRKPASSDDLTVKLLCNKFLTAMAKRLQAGKKMSPRMFAEYRSTAERMCKSFGKHTLVDDLGPDDFASFGLELHEHFGHFRQGNEIQKTRTIFKFAFDNELIDRPMRFGSQFEKPGKDEGRKHRATQGKRLFTAAEIHHLLDGQLVKVKGKKSQRVPGAGPQLRAMILLAINCGFGNNDVACLPKSVLDLEKGWVDFPRPKNGIQRRCPLWPETVAALRKALANRPAHTSPDDADCIFITKYGGRWVVERSTEPTEGPNGEVDLSTIKCTSFNSVSQEFKKLLSEHGINGRKRIGFYSIRHTFRTVADATKDFPAIRLIMGHADNSIDDVYREQIDDDRLQAIADHVHGWLFGKGGAK